MEINTIIQNWQNKQFAPVYWLEGEESFYIDQLTQYAENHILAPQEKDFNLIVLYGKDTHWADLLNACRRYPMFADKQVVIIKEAQQMKGWEMMEAYFENPANTTVCIIAYKGKKVDARTKFAKILKTKNCIYTFSKLKTDAQIVRWVAEYIESNNLKMNINAQLLIVQHIGNDLYRLDHELAKLKLNVLDREIVIDDIEKYIGISKEYNVFELQNAIGRKDIGRIYDISSYLQKHAKSFPMPIILATLHSYFAKLYVLSTLSTHDERHIAQALGVPPFYVKDYISAQKNYTFDELSNIILLIEEYNLKAIGVLPSSSDATNLLQELIGKILQIKKIVG